MRGWAGRELPVDVPELGRAGDIVHYNPKRPAAVYVTRTIPKAEAMEVIARLRRLAVEIRVDAAPAAQTARRPALRLEH